MGVELLEPSIERIKTALGYPWIDSDIAAGADINADKIGTGIVSNTEFNYLNGVTSAIQTQLDGKEPTLGFTPENVANKGGPSGYAGLDVSQKLQLVNFPSGSALQILRRNAGNTALEFATVAGAAAHELLSADHSDTLTASVTRGSIIVGNATPAWSRLTLGTVNQFLQSDGTDLSYVSLSGDATLAAGVMTIANTAVTYAKIQNVSATNLILGRDSAGAGSIEEITPAALRTMINVADGSNAYTHPNHTGDVTSTGDGVTAIAAGVIVNADINASAGIVTTKLADSANFVLVNQANSYGDGFKQTFNPDGTNAGINVGSQAGDPSTTVNGDIWYNSTTNKWRAKENGSVTDVIGAAGSFALNDITDVTITTAATGDILYKSAGDWINLAIGTNGFVLKVNAGIPTWTAEGGGSSHDLLSATHTDVAASAVSRGSIIVGNATPAWAEVTLGTAHQFLQSNGTDLGYVTMSGDATLAAGVISIGTDKITTAKILDDNVTYAKIQNITSTNVILGRITAGAGIIEELTAANVRTIINVADGANLYVHPNHTGDVTSVADGATTIANNAVTLPKLADIATASFMGRVTAATGDPEVLTGTQATTLLDVFTTSLKGLVPASGGLSTEYLSADGTFSVPAGGGGGITSINALSASSQTIAGETDKVIINSVTSTHTITLGTGIDNSNIAAAAAIDYSKLAALADGNILVGNVSNVATSVNPTGDIDISNTGVFSIAAGVIVNADINASAAIALSKLQTLSNGLLLGRGEPSSGVIQEIDPTDGLTINTSAQLVISDSGVTTVKINDNAVTLAKMVHGTAGNIITYDAAGAPAVVATGTSGQVLTSNGVGAAPTFQAAGAGSSPLTTKGDVFVYGVADDRLPVGVNGSILTADSTEALGVKWAATTGVGTGTNQTIVKQADEGKTTDTTLADDNELISPSLDVGKYIFESRLLIVPGTASGLKYNFTGGTATRTGIMSSTSWTTTPTINPNNITSTIVVAISGSQKYVMVTGTIDVTVAGTFGLQWAQNVSSVTTTTVQTGSYLTVKSTGSAGTGGTGISDIVEDTTPQLGGMLDVNGQSFGDGTLELLKFVETASAVNELTITNAATAGSPSLTATGDDANIDLTLDGKGTGTVKTLSSNLDITGNIIVSGTVDGKDIATNGVFINQANLFGDFLQTFKDNQLKINSPDDADGVTFVNSNQTADRNLTIPILTGNRNILVSGEGNIVNADINASAAIAQSKLAPLVIGDLPFGTAYQRIRTNAAATDPEYFTEQAGVPFVIDGGGSVITTGIKGDIEIPFDCVVKSVRMLADQSGSIVVDLWKDTYANYPPTVADSITASAVPTITTALKSEDSTLTGWTTTLTKGDIIRYNVDSVTSIQRVTISLLVDKT